MLLFSFLPAGADGDVRRSKDEKGNTLENGPGDEKMTVEMDKGCVGSRCFEICPFHTNSYFLFPFYLVLPHALLEDMGARYIKTRIKARARGVSFLIRFVTIVEKNVFDKEGLI